MKRIRNGFSISMIALSMLLGLAGFADAQRRNERDVRDAVRSLNSKIEDFEINLRYQMRSNSTNNSQISYISDDIRVLRNSVQRFQDNFERKRENRDDVTAIVTAARRVNDNTRANPQNRRVEDDWSGVRKQIERLGTNYGVSVIWEDNTDEPQYVKDYPPVPVQNRTISVGISGTYELDSARSERVDDIIAATRVGSQQREDLKEKLIAPQQIAIDIRGTQVTLATTDADPVTFTADGSDKREQSASGKSIRNRATLTGDKLIISSLGGETDYTITFTSVSDGKVLKVSRRITTDYLNQTVFAESVYNKTDSIAGLGIKAGEPDDDIIGGYSDNDQKAPVSNGRTQNRPYGVPSTVTTRPGNYTVPNGVVLTGILDNEINTKVSQNNDRFRMTVQSPDEFRGAVVDGYVSNIDRSGKVTGEATLTLNFEKIRLRNGQTFDFAGNLQSAQTLDGKNVSVDNEGTIKGESQTRQTAKRGGIGAGIGAVIGAIAGGAKGAAIGAIIGAGGGAGTVAIQGENDIYLQKGTTIGVVSSSPFQRDR